MLDARVHLSAVVGTFPSILGTSHHRVHTSAPVCVIRKVESYAHDA